MSTGAPAFNNRVYPRRMGVLIVVSVLLFAVSVGVGIFSFLGGFEDDATLAKRQLQQAANARALKAKQVADSLSHTTTTTSKAPSSPLEKSIDKMVTRSTLLKRLMLNRQISRETMFVNTASFRDVFCRQTVRNIYEMALHPERIFMGVIDQRMAGDIMCIPPEYLRSTPMPHLPLSPYVTTTIPKDKDPVHQPVLRRFQSCWKSNGFCPLDNIRNRIVHDTEARGPTYGRFVGGLMYQGESFYMMIDSHSMFAPHFDEFYILDILRMKESFIVEPSTSSLSSKKQENDETSGNGGVISNYPGTFNRFDKTPNYADNLVSMCRIHYVKELKILRNGVSHVAQAPRRKPLRQPHTAGGFLFSDATVQLVVPYDPYLDFVFDGEEVLYSIRLFTRGIDAYMPSMPNIFHHYERHKAHRFWSVKGTKWGKYVEITRQRLHYFMQTYHNQTTKLLVDSATAHKKGVADSEDVYAPGNTRSVQAFYDYAGIGRSTWKVSDDFCNRVTREASALQKSIPDWRW